MRRHWMVLALVGVLISGCGGGAETVPTDGPSLLTGTSPTAADPPASASLGHRILQSARHYRGNPVWLGVVTGVLLLGALAYAALTVRPPGRDPDRLA